MSARRVAIVGGGISGLAAAHRLIELSRATGVAAEVAVFEAQARAGGTIRTTRQDGFLLEHGPDAFITDKPWALALCRRLGLAEALVETQPRARRSFILRDGRPVEVPEGLYLMAPARMGPLWRSPLVSWRGKLRMACEPLIPPRRDEADESVGAFIRRRFGREALERIGQPMVGGIYTADPDELSLRATLPRFERWERAHGSVVRGLRASRSAEAARAAGPRYGLFMSLRDGLQRLVDALAQRLPSGIVRLGAPVAGVRRRSGWRIALADGGAWDADAVCLALPAPQAARLLRDGAPEVAEPLAQIRYESVATVNLGYRAADVPRPLEGAGVVMPAVERRSVVGCSFASVKFPGRAPSDGWLARAFVGGALHRGALDRDDAALVALVRAELRDVLQITADPRCAVVSRHPAAMPQYAPDHLERVAAIERQAARLPGLHLAGNGYRGLGIPDCVWLAERVAERLVGEWLGLEATDGA